MPGCQMPLNLSRALLDCVPHMGSKLPRLKAIDYDLIERTASLA
jgi:hypothetical protein